MTFTIINKILFIILIAWRKLSILDINVKSVGKIIIPWNIVEKSSSMTPIKRCTNFCPDMPLFKTS